MFRSTTQYLFILAAPALLVACSGSLGPGDDALEAELTANHLPASWELESLTTTAEENIGSEVEPVINSRFEFEVELQQDLYDGTVSSQPLESQNGRTVSYIDGKRVIEKVRSQGETERVFGLARATRRGEGWRIALDLESTPWRYAGQPLSAFGNDYVIAGSEAENELIDRVHQAWEEEQRRIAEEERRKREALAKKTEDVLAFLETGFSDIEAEKHGSFVNAIAEYAAPERAERRFDFPVVFDGAEYTYNAIVREGAMQLTDPEGNCHVTLVPADSGDGLEGVSNCSLMPGAVRMTQTTEEALAEKYREADERLMSFFRNAQSEESLSLVHRNLTFGGVDNYAVTITNIDGNTIYLAVSQYNRDAGSAVWYVKYGKVRSRTTSAFWYFLEYHSPERLEGRRYNNRPNRPIGLELRRG